MGLGSFAATLVKIGVLQDKKGPRKAAVHRGTPEDDMWGLEKIEPRQQHQPAPIPTQTPSSSSTPLTKRKLHNLLLLPPLPGTERPTEKKEREEKTQQADATESIHSTTHIMDVAGFQPRHKGRDDETPAKRQCLSTGSGSSSSSSTPPYPDESASPPSGVGVTGSEYALDLLQSMLKVLPSNTEEIGFCLDRGAPARKGHTQVKRDTGSKTDPLRLDGDAYLGLSGFYHGAGGAHRRPGRVDAISVTTTRGLRPSVLACLTRVVSTELRAWPSNVSRFSRFPKLKSVWLDGIFLVVSTSPDPENLAVSLNYCDETRKFTVRSSRDSVSMASLSPNASSQTPPPPTPPSLFPAGTPSEPPHPETWAWDRSVEPHLLAGEGENACVEAALKRCPNGAQIHSIDLDVVFVLALSLARADFKRRTEFDLVESISEITTPPPLVDLTEQQQPREEDKEDFADVVVAPPASVTQARKRYEPHNVVALLARERYLFDPVTATHNLRKNGLTWAELAVWVSLEKTDYCDPKYLTPKFGSANRRLLAELWVTAVAGKFYPRLLLDYKSRLSHLDASTIDILELLHNRQAAQCLVDLVEMMRARKTKKDRQAMTVDIYRASIFKNMVPTELVQTGLADTQYQVRYFYLGIEGMLDHWPLLDEDGAE
jgi:hypothetical protein